MVRVIQRCWRRYLLDAGAHVETTWSDGYKPFTMASRLGYQAVLAEILEAGTNVDQAMDEGFPVAARTRRAVRSCSGAECTSRSRGRDGQGVRGRWKHGAEKGYIDILVELLEAGADVDRAKTDGVTPLYLDMWR